MKTIFNKKEGLYQFFLLIFFLIISPCYIYSQVFQQSNTNLGCTNSNIINLGIGNCSPYLDTRITIKNTTNFNSGGKANLVSELNSTGDFGLLSAVNRDNSKSFAGFYNDGNGYEETFIVYGNGNTEISGILKVFTENTQLAMFAYNDNNAGATRPRLNIWGSPNKINLRTTYNTGGAELSLGTNSVPDALLVKDNGKIMIGNVNTNGNYLLYVEKGILAEKVRVALKNTGDWADHVFQKDYPLMTLNQLEKFILKEKHLPQIPSATELLEKGIDLGKMDARLLEKIEELTLYTIEQEKQILNLKSENEAVKKRLIEIEKLLLKK